MSKFLLFFLTALSMQAQPLTCSARQYPPTTVRVEGYTELLGDMVVACTGGTPTPAGALIPFVDVTLSVGSVPITNRKSPSETFIDALLLMDEPHSVANPNVPLVPCVSCAAPLGNGTGSGVYNGSTGYPNVFQGELTGSSTVRFRVPFDPPGPNVERIVRIANVRVNGTRMAGVVPNTVVGTINIPGAAMSPATQILGIAHRALVISNVLSVFTGPRPNPGVLSACPDGRNTRTTRGGLPVPDYVLNIEEPVGDGLRARSVGQDQASGPAGIFGSTYASDKNQNVIGYPYGAETGVYSGSFTNPSKPVPQIGASAPFIASRGLDRAGLATHGTRFYISLSNVGNLRVSLPVSIVFQAQSRAQAAPTRAILIQADSTSSSGSFVPVLGDARGFARIANNGSTATAIYEVVSADAMSPEWAAIPIYVDQPAAAAGTFVDNGKVMITVGLGPASEVSGPDATAPIPRFRSDVSDTVEGFVYSPEGCFPLQDVSVTFGTPRASTAQSGTVDIFYRDDSDRRVPGVVFLDVTLPPGFEGSLQYDGGALRCTSIPLRCIIDIYGAAFTIRLAYTAPANAPAVVPFVATVTAAGDQVPSNNTNTLWLRTRYSSNVSIDRPSLPQGLLVSVNGIYRQSNLLVEPSQNTTVEVSTIANQYSSDGSLWIFNRWSDQGALTHSLGANLSTVGATFDAADGSSMICSASLALSGAQANEKTAALGDVMLRCTGGTVAPVGSPLPKVDIRVSVGSLVTSRQVFPGVSEAMLIINEPRSEVNRFGLLLACGANGSGNDANGICFNKSAGASTYNGLQDQPNVFQGVFDGADSILFPQVPLQGTGAAEIRYLRIVNLRFDASLLPVSFGDNPGRIEARVSISGSGSKPVTVLRASSTLVEQPLQRPSITTTAFLAQCQAANPQIAVDPAKPLDNGTGNGTQAMVVISEANGNAFKPKSEAVVFSNSVDGAVAYPPDSKQNVPGGLFAASHTLFYAGPGAEPNLYYLVPRPPASGDFPAFRGLNVAGKADSGTRVAVRFTGIPTGVKIFVPVRITLQDQSSNEPSGIAQLTSSDSAGAGSFSQVTGNAAGLSPLSVIGGEATAFYEILRADRVDRMAIPVAFAYTGQPPLGTIQVTAGLAPVVAAPGNATDVSGIIPRYAAFFPDPQPIAFIQGCAQPDLQVSFVRSGLSTYGEISTYRFTVTNVGPVTTSIPRGLFLEGYAIQNASGAGWTCTKSPSVTSAKCDRSDPLAPGASYPPVELKVFTALRNDVTPLSPGARVAASLSTDEANKANDRVEDFSTMLVGGQKFIPLATPCRVLDTRSTAGGTLARLRQTTYRLQGKCGLPPIEALTAATAYALNVTVVPKTTLGYLTIWPAGQEQPVVSTLNSLDGRVKANFAIVPAGANSDVSVFATEDTEVILDLTGYFANTGGMNFFPVDPCRVVDTRNPAGQFGGPVLAPMGSRAFPISTSNCVTGGNRVYSLNATVVPSGPLGYLTLYNPTLAVPTVSTLNALTGAITANGLLIGGSDNGLGQIAALATDQTHLLLDINGYFRVSDFNSGMWYHPIPPCRLVDTRNPVGPYGGPALGRATERVFDFPAGGCGIPASAKSFAVNATVVPGGPFGFLTIWPTGTPRPTVSTLNALDGAITSNAAIVSSTGTGPNQGKISVYGSDATHLILDVNGYFTDAGGVIIANAPAGTSSRGESSTSLPEPRPRGHAEAAPNIR